MLDRNPQFPPDVRDVAAAAVDGGAPTDLLEYTWNPVEPATKFVMLADVGDSVMVDRTVQTDAATYRLGWIEGVRLVFWYRDE